MKRKSKAKSKPKKKTPGPKPERLKLDGNWSDRVADSFKRQSAQAKIELQAKVRQVATGFEFDLRSNIPITAIDLRAEELNAVPEVAKGILKIDHKTRFKGDVPVKLTGTSVRMLTVAIRLEGDRAQNLRTDNLEKGKWIPLMPA